jgi:3-hydroxyisobutyrate dehydrogenase-like beta-hydroxyacid dehydrogenase
MISQRLLNTTARRCYSSSRTTALSLHNNADTIGFIGLGHMGSKMVANMSNDGKNLLVFDMSTDAVSKVTNQSNATQAQTIEEIGEKCSVVFSMLPNDKAVSAVSDQLLKGAGESKEMIHVSCSTISPVTSRGLAAQYTSQNKQFIASPVFARPDGISKRQATWMIAGESNGRAIAAELLESSGNCVDYGDDTGASNVVKLCGNFLIASTIEAVSEAMALAEKHNVDRKDVMNMLSGSIFDCLIYKGYGQRVSERDHRPGGFSLELGLKDCTLVNAAAREADVPMPFLSVLLDRYTSAKAKGRADFDWSAIGLSVAEDAGIDVSADVARTRKDVDEGNLY